MLSTNVCRSDVYVVSSFRYVWVENCNTSQLLKALTKNMLEGGMVR